MIETAAEITLIVVVIATGLFFIIALVAMSIQIIKKLKD